MRHQTKCSPIAMLAAVLAVVSAAAQTGTESGKRGDDYIQAEVKGRFSRAAATGGEHTGFQIRANGVTWEIDASASSTLLQKADQLDGKVATATGTYTERRSVSRVRRILTVQALEAGTETGRSEYIDVTVRGTLKTGVIAIGAETTGVMITAGGVTWELELDRNQHEIANKLNGGKAIVSGQLRHETGVEIGNRFIIKLRSIKSG